MPSKDTLIKILLITILLLIVGGVIAHFVNINKDKPTIQNQFDLIDVDNGSVKQGRINENDYNTIKQKIQADTDDSYILWEQSSMIFENGKDEGRIAIGNRKEDNVLKQVEVIDNKTKERLYISPVLQPGEYLENGKLLKELTKGEYEVVATHRAYNTETEQLINSFEFETVLTVLN
ncbi:hypothetical protein SDC9_50168 [bioreactor metagenome]|uniref:Uncharacterized protein n=1 Tax=bioreactor metagenome TaxID=1076179 RepID=A0A644WK24_9ZZZZ